MASVIVIVLIWTCVLYPAVTGSASSYIRKSIGPVAECDGEPESLTSYMASCHAKCLMEPEPTGVVSVALHQSNAAGPVVVECTKIKRVQTFTQTWTFSTIDGDISSTYENVTIEECQTALKENCPTYNCDHREKDTLTPEYHYGSDTTVTETTITLLTIPSILMYEEEGLLISPMSSRGKFSHDSYSGREGKTVYLWKAWDKPSTCPFKLVKTYGCDIYSDDGTYYVCSGGRFILTPNKEVTVAADVCQTMRRSTEGFIYQISLSTPDEESSSRLGISTYKMLEADASFLRHKIHQISTHLDSEICSNQCELLAIETRLSLRSESLMRVGNEYILAYRNGTGVRCVTLHGCHLPEKKLFCGNPARIGVVCTSTSGFWDPTKAYIMKGNACHKPDERENLTVSLGSEHYIIDQDLTISAPVDIAHGVYPVGYTSLHMSGIQLDIQSLQQLKDPWLSSKKNNSGISHSVSSNKSVRSPQLSIGESVMSVFSGIGGWFSSVEHAIGTFVMIVIICCGLMLTTKLLSAVKGRMKHTEVHVVPEQHQLITKPPEDTPGWR